MITPRQSVAVDVANSLAGEMVAIRSELTNYKLGFASQTEARKAAEQENTVLRAKIERVDQQMVWLRDTLKLAREWLDPVCDEGMRNPEGVAVAQRIDSAIETIDMLSGQPGSHGPKSISDGPAARQV